MENNNSVGSAFVKIVAITGGALIGAILANWCDKLLSNIAQERSDYDKERYAQGLSSRETQPDGKRSINSQPRIIRIEHPETVPYPEERDS